MRYRFNLTILVEGRLYQAGEVADQADIPPGCFASLKRQRQITAVPAAPEAVPIESGDGFFSDAELVALQSPPEPAEPDAGQDFDFAPDQEQPGTPKPKRNRKGKASAAPEEPASAPDQPASV